MLDARFALHVAIAIAPQIAGVAVGPLGDVAGRYFTLVPDDMGQALCLVVLALAQIRDFDGPEVKQPGKALSQPALRVDAFLTVQPRDDRMALSLFPNLRLGSLFLAKGLAGHEGGFPASDPVGDVCRACSQILTRLFSRECRQELPKRFDLRCHPSCIHFLAEVNDQIIDEILVRRSDTFEPEQITCVAFEEFRVFEQLLGEQVVILIVVRFQHAVVDCDGPFRLVGGQHSAVAVQDPAAHRFERFLVLDQP